MKIKLRNPKNTARIVVAAFLFLLVMSGSVEGSTALFILIIAFVLSFMAGINRGTEEPPIAPSKKEKSLPHLLGDRRATV